MKLHFIRYILIGLGIIVLAICFKVLLDKWTLHNCQVFIESEYKSQLSLIEHEMQIGKDPNGWEGIEAREQLRERLEKALAAPEIFAAAWSTDGHHGLESLKRMPTSYSYLWLIKSSNDSHYLCFGEADDSTKLLVYIGKVESKWKRHYTVSFRKSDIFQKMKSR